MNEKLKYYAWTWQSGEDSEKVFTLTDEPVSGTRIYSVPNVLAGVAVEITEDGIIFQGRTHQRDTEGDVETSLYRPIVKPEEMLSYTRLEYADEDKLVRIIHEAEILNVKPNLGNGLYSAIITNPPQHEFDTLLEGGVYQFGGKDIQFEGLKAATAYYSFARVNQSSIVTTRYGQQDKRTEYSYQSTLTERQKLVREAFEIADRHMKDCLIYINANPGIFGGFGCKCSARKFRSPHTLRFKIIGN